jgi:hypothetical protein
MPVPDLIADLLARLARFERIHEYEAQLIHKDGSLRTVVINSSVMAVRHCFGRVQLQPQTQAGTAGRGE